jgi:hypothetical protein
VGVEQGQELVSGDDLHPLGADTGCDRGGVDGDEWHGVDAQALERVLVDPQWTASHD